MTTLSPACTQTGADHLDLETVEGSIDQAATTQATAQATDAHIQDLLANAQKNSIHNIKLLCKGDKVGLEKLEVKVKVGIKAVCAQYSRQ